MTPHVTPFISDLQVDVARRDRDGLLLLVEAVHDARHKDAELGVARRARLEREPCVRYSSC